MYFYCWLICISHVSIYLYLFIHFAYLFLHYCFLFCSSCLHFCSIMYPSSSSLFSFHPVMQLYVLNHFYSHHSCLLFLFILGSCWFLILHVWSLIVIKADCCYFFFHPFAQPFNSTVSLSSSSSCAFASSSSLTTNLNYSYGSSQIQSSYRVYLQCQLHLGDTVPLILLQSIPNST